MEHRLGRRFATCERVLLRSPDGGVSDAVLTDLSLSGAFVRTTVRVAPLSTVHIVLSCQLGPRKTEAVLMAQVIRHSARGLGVEWSALASPLVQARLSTLGHQERAKHA